MVWNGSFTTLFFCYLDIFRCFTVRRLLLNRLVEYCKLSLYDYNGRFYVRIQKYLYQQKFNFVWIDWLRRIFIIIFKEAFSETVLWLFIKVVYYIYRKRVDQFVVMLRDLFFEGNFILYVFFRVSLWFLSLRGRIDMFIRYKSLDYYDKASKQKFWSRINMSFKRFSNIFAHRFAQILKHQDSSVYENGQVNQGVSGVDKLVEMEDTVGRSLDVFRQSSEGVSLDNALMQQMRIENVSIIRILVNYLRYFLFFFFLAVPWYFLDGLFYIIFDLFFVFLFFYVYIYFRVFIFVFFGIVLGFFFVVWVCIKGLFKLFKGFFRMCFDFIKQLD
jgi:hypothetical protein